MEDIMTLAMEAVELEHRELLDLRALEATPSSAHQALRDHPEPQEEATTGSLDHLGLLDLQDQCCPGLTGEHRQSVFLDPRDHLELLDYLDTPQG